MHYTQYWFIQTLGYWSMVFLLVPIDTIKMLLPFGIIGGFGYTTVVQLLAVNVSNNWIFSKDLLIIWNIPIFFVLGWFGVTMLYGYFLLRYPKYQLGIIFIFASIATIINYFGLRHGMVKLLNWSLLETFYFAVFSHVLILYLFRLLYKKKEYGAPLP